MRTKYFILVALFAIGVSNTITSVSFAVVHTTSAVACGGGTLETRADPVIEVEAKQIVAVETKLAARAGVGTNCPKGYFLCLGTCCPDGSHCMRNKHGQVFCIVQSKKPTVMGF